MRAGAIGCMLFLAGRGGQSKDGGEGDGSDMEGEEPDGEELRHVHVEFKVVFVERYELETSQSRSIILLQRQREMSDAYQ